MTMGQGVFFMNDKNIKWKFEIQCHKRDFRFLKNELYYRVIINDKKHNLVFLDMELALDYCKQKIKQQVKKDIK